MSFGHCPKYGTVECAAGVCFVCNGQLDEGRCPPVRDVIQIDIVYGWEGTGDPNDLSRRPTTLGTMTVLKPQRDIRPD